MSQILPVIFTTVLVILTIVLSVVGIQMVMVLVELKRTLRKVNETIENAETKIHAIVSPLQNLGGMAVALQAGTSAFEKLVDWLNRDKEEKQKKEKK